MLTERVVVMLTETDLAKVKEKAGAVPVSAWIRMLVVAEVAKPDLSFSNLAKAVAEERAGLRSEEPISQKISETRVEERTKWRPRRGHASDDPGVRESRGGKCGYMAKPGKKCPACGAVHS